MNNKIFAVDKFQFDLILSHFVVFCWSWPWISALVHKLNDLRKITLICYMGFVGSVHILHNIYIGRSIRLSWTRHLKSFRVEYTKTFFMNEWSPRRRNWVNVSYVTNQITSGDKNGSRFRLNQNNSEFFFFRTCLLQKIPLCDKSSPKYFFRMMSRQYNSNKTRLKLIL